MIRTRTIALLLFFAGLSCKEPRQFEQLPDSGARPVTDGMVDSSDGRFDGPDEMGSSTPGPQIDASPLGAVDMTTVSTGDATVSTPVCGNGQVETGEMCDPVSSCPASCPPRGCTEFALEGAAGSCTSRCVESGKRTACTPNDGCCPPGCNAQNDTDCLASCGNGVKEGTETCDPMGTCPIGCPSSGCQLKKLINATTCNAECINDRIQTACVHGDGCCPPSCHRGIDNDCESRCGNGFVEEGETCDPTSDCTRQRTDCVSSKDLIRIPMGDAAQCSFRCDVMARGCGPSDGFCPTGCSPSADADCRKVNGQLCSSANECVSGSCVDGFCCDRVCGKCQECRGPNGTCINITKGLPDNYPSGACEGDSICDGAGGCMIKAKCGGRNEPCCEGQTCPGPNMLPGVPLGCFQESGAFVCKNCGLPGMRCCSSGDPCREDGWKRCSTTTTSSVPICLADPCGGEGQPCCVEKFDNSCAPGLKCVADPPKPGEFYEHVFCRRP